MSIKWNKIFLQKLDDLDSQRLQPELRGMYTARTHRDVYKNLESPLNETQQRSDITHVEISNVSSAAPSRAKTAPAVYKLKQKEPVSIHSPLLDTDSKKMYTTNVTNTETAENSILKDVKKNDFNNAKKPSTAAPRNSQILQGVDHSISFSKPEMYSNKSIPAETHSTENFNSAPKVSTLTPFSRPTPPDKPPTPLNSNSPRIEKPSTRSPKVMSQSLKLTPENKKEYFSHLQKSWSDQIEFFKEKDRKEKNVDRARRLENESEILRYIEKEKEQRLKRYNDAKNVMKENYNNAVKRREHNGMEPASYFMEDRKVLYYSSKEQMARDLQKQMEEKSLKQRAERELDLEEGRRRYEETIEMNKKQDEVEESLRRSKKRDQLKLLDTQMKEITKLGEMRKSKEQLELKKLNLVTIEPREDSADTKREKAKKLLEEQSTAYFNFLQTKELTKQNLKELQKRENESFQQQLHKEQLRKLKKMEDEQRSLRESWSQQESEKKSSKSKERAEETSLYATSLF